MREGRDLDALVAREVMGWTYTAYGNGGGKWTLDGKEMAFGGYNGGSLPRWSSTVADSMQVVMKMIDLGHVFIIKGDGLRKGSKVPKWTLLCDDFSRMDPESLPFGICQIAIKARAQKKMEAERGGYAGTQQE